MRSSTLYLCLGLSPLLASCASTSKLTELDTVGPAPLRMSGAAAPSEGSLKVYSLRGSYNAEGVYYHPHTAYTIYSSDNTRLKEVRNARFPHDEEPVAVGLPAGNYVVVALADGYLRVRVPVVIESGQLTTLHLDSSSRASADEGSEWVRLPNGQAVGWRVNLVASGTSAGSGGRPGQ
jgi:hypothetical protein